MFLHKQNQCHVQLTKLIHDINTNKYNFLRLGWFRDKKPFYLFYQRFVAIL
jgi:hypothetical protein